MDTESNCSALLSIWSSKSQVNHTYHIIFIINKWRNGAREWSGKNTEAFLPVGQSVCRRKHIPVLNPKVWNIQHQLYGHFSKCLHQTGDRLSPPPNLPPPRKTTTNNENRTVFLLSQVCLQENLWCLLVLTILLFWKPETSSACTPGRKLERENLCKLKFVTVGRTVALQLGPISGCTASQLHCKVLKILPPTPEYIYVY